MKLEDVVFLDAADVEAEHARRLASHGGTEGTRDHGLLESAVARPQATFDGVPLYPTVATMAAALIVGIAKNHPFVDGNKRTALASGLAFLDVNGHPVTVGLEWVDIMVKVAEGTFRLDDVAAELARLMGGDVDIERSPLPQNFGARV